VRVPAGSGVGVDAQDMGIDAYEGEAEARITWL
jgi:hypothetical protein